MKVGVWLNSNIDPSVGGGYSYSAQMAILIDAHTFTDNIEVCFLGFNDILFPGRNAYHKLIPPGSIWSDIEKLTGKYYTLRKINGFLKRQISRRKRRLLHEQLKDLKIDMIYYLSQMECHIPNYPFISTNWDLGHLTLPALPEVSEQNELSFRRKWYNNILPKAEMVFVESESGREEMEALLKVDPNRIKVVPMFSSDFNHIRISKSEERRFLAGFKLKPGNYFFYPAQFWEHKNHALLVKSFSRLVKDFPKVELVFTGADKGHWPKIKSQINELNLTDRVKYPGFVSIVELVALYRNAIALVMPTFLGPTNIPPLEARTLNCPVICSDLAGHKEQLGKGALYFDPKNENQLYTRLVEIMNDQKRQEVLNNAQEEIKTSVFDQYYAIEQVEKHLLKYISNTAL
ncbi:glycosyltransferase family 4 protein [Aureitalea sp. L0-47]|uniref:glycosyltransferase family 4 protein n=1 Tax=Aureitalea sp. L0-47 TaxID=2816962 RepID=UPI00223811D1|nr:glycosyltransferase family 1 protein [Aureitalea sp. L0-47]MCW5519192.1 glycosyltransferase family 4 protein [Aureitalea sp. L0-47]